MAAEDDKLAEEIGEGFGGSLLSKLLFGLSWFILLTLLTCPFWRIQDYAPDGTLVSSRWPWEAALGCAIRMVLHSLLLVPHSKTREEGTKGRNSLKRKRLD